MRFAIGMAKVNSWLPESFAKKSSVKLLGGLAVGAMLIMAITFTYDQLRQDDAASLSSNTQITESSEASAYWVQRDEAEEMAYDELSKNFIGIPSPGTKITGRFLFAEDLHFMIQYFGRFLSDEDLRFMIQYLNELKEDEVTNSTLNDVRQIK